MTAKKRFGQNFLAEPEIAARIVRAAGVRAGERVLEIGPGHGMLTEQLVAAGAVVTAIELDRELILGLRHLPITLIEGDALTVELPAVDRVVANLPYNIATPVLVRLLERRVPMALMFQREVAERLVAVPHTRDYGSLSVHVQLRARPEIVLTLPPSAFRPQPKVHSTVVRFTPVPLDFAGVDPAAFAKVVRLGFSQRRKTIANSLGSGIGKEVAIAVLAAAGIDPIARAETIDLAGWRRLAVAARAAGVGSAPAPGSGGEGDAP